MRRARARRALVACAVLAVPLLAGCGAKEEALTSARVKPFAVALDAPPGAVHAALYAALAHGDFRAAGLDVRIEPPPGRSEALARLASGSAQMALCSEPQLLLARDHGLAAVSIGALAEQPAHGGTPAYEDPVLAVATRAAERDGEDLRAFMHALARGALTARGDPAGTARLIAAADRAAGEPPPPSPPRARRGRRARHGKRGEPTPEARRVRALEQALRTAPAGARGSGGANAEEGPPFGYQDPSAWSRLASAMYRGHQLHANPAQMAPPFTNEYLPGQGL